MKLLLVTPYFYPKIGGLENYAYNIAKGLKKKFGWDIVVITSNHREKKKTKETIEGISVYRLPPLFKISNTPINPFWYFDVKRIISIEKPNIINAHAPVPFMADVTAKAAGNIPFILTYHAGSMKKGNFLLDLVINTYETLFLSHLFKKAQVVICSSVFVKNSLVAGFTKKIHVVSPAVDTNIFTPSTVKKRKNILFVGRHANVYTLKGLPYVLQAIKNIPQAKLTIVGEKISLNQKNVTFIGIKSGKQLAKVIQNAQMLVLPSIAPMESFGMVLIEAMACKTPIIGTRMGGIPEIIQHKKNGLLVTPKNGRELQSAIEILLQNKEMANFLTNNALTDIRNKYLWDLKVEATNKILSKYLIK